MSHRLRWPLGLVTATLALALALWPASAESPPLAALVGSAATAKTALPDPIPIHRVFVPIDRLEGQLGILGRDQFTKMTREDFESQVQRAAREQLAERFPPQIVEAKYRARLLNGRLIGTGQWNLKNPTGRAAAVSLEPLGSAIRDAKWGVGKPALLFRGTLNGQANPSTYLWADDATGGTVDFAWSLRGLDEPEEERFDLSFPASPIAQFELVTPAERIPAISAGVGFLTGPFPADIPTDRLWKFSFGGQTRIEIAVRRPLPTDESSAVILNRTARWALSATERTGTIELSVESARGSSPTRTFTLDPGLVVTDLSGSDVDSWRTAGSNLIVQFHKPPSTTKLLVHCESALPAPNGWLCPTIRLPGALPGNDFIEIACTTDVKLESWLPGDFRSGSATADRITKLTFTGTLLPAFGEDRIERRMPTLRYRTTESEYRSEESLTWKVEPGRNTLVATLKLTVLHSPLAALSIQTIPGYSPAAITSIPDDPGLTWVAVPGVANTWMIEPSKAIPGGGNVEFRIDVRGAAFPRIGNPANSSQETVSLPFPRVRPLGTGERQLTFSGNVGAGLNGTFATSTTEMRREGTGIAAVFRNRDAEGELLITTVPPRVECTLETAVSSREENRLSITSLFHGRIENAVAGGVTLFVPGESEPKITLDGLPSNAKSSSPPDGWNWAPLAGARSGWQAIGASALLMCPTGSFWYVPFLRPYSGDFRLGVDYSIAAKPSPTGAISFPLVSLGGCVVREFKSSLDPALAEKFQPPSTISNNLATLIPRNRNIPATIDRTSDWQLADVQMRNTVDAEGRIRCSLRGRVVRAGGPVLEISHATAFEQLESVSVGSHEVPMPLGRQRDTLRIPISTPGETFEISYRIPSGTAGFLATACTSPLPQIPGAESIEQIWHTTGVYLWWPSLSGQDSTANSTVTRWIVRATVLRAVGYGFAALLLAFGWYRLFQPRRQSVDLLCLSLAVALGLADWIDTEGWRFILRPALLASLIVLTGNFLRAGRTIHPVLARATVASLFLFATVDAQAPEPINVYFVPSENNAITAYVPKTLVARLESLATSPLPNALFTDAEYTVNANKEFATIDATYRFHCPHDGEQVIDLPLTGVRLEGAKLDGAAAFLDGSKPDRFGVPVRTAGPHTLQLSFAVPIAIAGNDRDIRFGVPDVPSCQVSLLASLRGRQVDVTSRRGGQTVSFTREGLKAIADHGSGKAIQLRWREDGTAEGAKPTVSIRETCLWDLGESESSCVAAFLYRIQGGTISQLKLECPEGLEPWRVEVRTNDARPMNIGVKTWNVGTATNGWLPITVKLQSPVDGRIAVVVTARPHKLPSLRPTLRFPRSADVADGERDSFFALRTNGIALDTLTTIGTVDLPADALTKDFSGIPELNLEKAPVRVLRRTTNAATELKPQMSLPAIATGGELEIAYTLGRRIGAEGRLKGLVKEGAVLEFDLPAAMKLYDLTGPSLAGWGRSGNRIQIWFKKGTVGEVEATFHGALGYDMLAPGGKPPEGVIDLPLPRWPLPVSFNGKPLIVRVRVVDGWEATASSTIGLKNIEPLPPAPGHWTYLVDAQPGQLPHAKFTLKQAEAKLESPIAPSPPIVPNSGSEKSSNPQGGQSHPDTPAPHPQTRNWLPWVAAIAWLLGMVVAARLPVRRWPERVGLLGLLGAAALGFASIAGMLMLAVAAFGLAARVRKFLS